VTLRLNDFDYPLPEELIAQEPARPRDHSRLLIYRRETGEIRDDHFYNLPEWLPEETTLVANNSRVEKCRLLFDGGKREIFVVNRLGDDRVEALVRPGKRFRKGRTVTLTDELSVEVVEVAEDGLRTLKLAVPLDDSRYDPWRATPFPPYIRRNESLAESYQTIYASDSGSKAAPTAGLHFTDRLIRKLREQGVGWEEVTLHVGLGTFAPVKTERLEDHTMHSEWYQIGREVADRLNRAHHLTAVGTTSVRVLESAVGEEGRFSPSSGETDIFIRPGYQFRSVDALITNFHLPKSTLLMLVAAMTGFDEMHRIYRHAIRERYRFFSFGDAMLIL